MSLDKLSRLVDQQRKIQDEIDNEIILAVKEVLATNSVGLARELVGGPARSSIPSVFTRYS
ncbi:hypothetical protein [Escherichia coli]|uniref:hypothetical protein n=1 Tax=Escherichia coli TaxID=562 RepID=UPI000291DF33|nr:hypothetical protein [Escherichia coli]EJE74181.1 hypothetical protein ECO9634_12591 [Escherichia coli O111:H8 str. CVM9634]